MGDMRGKLMAYVAGNGKTQTSPSLSVLPGDRVYISVMATLKFKYFLIKGIMSC